MLAILERIDAQSDSIDLLVELFDALRPRHPSNAVLAASNVRTLCQLLKGNPQQAWALRNYMLRVLACRRHTSLYTDIGILSSDGFVTELLRRISYRILPPALGDVYLSDALDQILYLRTDYRWISAVPATDWLDLFDTLAPTDNSPVGEGHVALAGMLEAIRTLSYRVCAIGLEPRLIRIHPDIEKFESPFLMQNVEVNAYLDDYARLLDGGPGTSEDAKHLLVMLDQCDGVIARIRKNALHQGTSIALTYLLVALTQSIDRLRKLLFLVDVTGQLPGPVVVGLAPSAASDAAEDAGAVPAISPRRAAAVTLALELIEGHNNKYAVRELFAGNIDLLARNVTENASRTGEHYIAESRSVTGAMFLSSAGAGFIIGFMALLKIMTSWLRTAPLVEAFLYSLNYAFGFMLIHLLHFTIATKQPAMTASRIAAGLHSKDGRNIDLDSMAELIVKVLRTQFVAVLGNLATAIPTAYLIAVAYAAIMGHHLTSPEEARHLLHDIDPVASLALFQAMIAGVCLFLAGLISGYYDNKALYTRMAQRVSQLRDLGRLLGQDRLHRLAHYVEDNLGGLMGNFYFGILLGTIGTLGQLLGLPIDIRHITFSAANFSTALVGLDNQLTWHLALTSIIGIFSIGSVNLLVSFGLALWVALRSRQVRFEHGILLLKTLARRFWTGPIDFFIAPKDVVEAVPAQNSTAQDQLQHQQREM